jgi:thioredoxin-like negative regulator of GroEL
MSSISAISGASSPLATDTQNNPRALFQQLTQAINSGDLTVAQQTYQAITQQLNQGGQSASSTSPLASDMSAIGQALNSGNITGAQQALATLQSDAQKLGGHHHHHHKTQAASTTSTTAATSTNPLLGSNLNVSA